jgi:cytochrome oxidase Cu insertion factor (SCO1/SenC/PrrC family)
MSPAELTRRGRHRSMLIGLALLFFAPLGLAFFLYYGLHWRPGGQLNHGDLVEPPLPLPDLALRRVETTAAPDAAPALGAGAGDALTPPDFLKGKWTLLYFGPGSCPDACRADLYDTRQVRTALGKDESRVQRVFLAEGACCDLALLRTEHPDLLIVRATDEAAPLVALLRRAVPEARDRIYLIDPLGNLMMSYAADAPPKGLLEDLKRLLGLSHVG